MYAIVCLNAYFQPVILTNCCVNECRFGVLSIVSYSLKCTIYC